MPYRANRTRLLLPLTCILASTAVLLSIFVPSTSLTLRKNPRLFTLDTRFVLHPAAYLPDANVKDRFHARNESNPRSYGLSDFYAVGLFSECKGEFHYEGASESEVWRLKECSSRSLTYKFDPLSILREVLKDRKIEGMIPVPLARLDKHLSKNWGSMVTAFGLGFLSNAITAFLALIGLVWQWGAAVEAFFAMLAAAGTFVSALMTHNMVRKVKSSFEDAETILGVRVVLNETTPAWLWFSFALSTTALGLYLWQTSCCGVNSAKHALKRDEEAAERFEREKERLAMKLGGSVDTSYSNGQDNDSAYDPPVKPTDEKRMSTTSTIAVNDLPALPEYARAGGGRVIQSRGYRPVSTEDTDSSGDLADVPRTPVHREKRFSGTASARGSMDLPRASMDGGRPHGLGSPARVKLDAAKRFSQVEVPGEEGRRSGSRSPTKTLVGSPSPRGSRGSLVEQRRSLYDRQG